MAYTVTRTDSAFGDQRVALIEVTADAASGTIPLPFNAVKGWSIGPKSMATSAVIIKASTALLTVSAAVSGDNFMVVVYGK